ncbi:MAG: hypothetical protein JO339_38455 [Alphaproteobacteria bacterium]|nr:hypothetical protein [Alphaproteobacteria bacterium]
MSLLVGIAFLLSACVESGYYGAPTYSYGYPAYGSLNYVGWGGWGGWHHGWDHGHWDGHVQLAHEARGGWGHGFSGHAGFGGHGGGHGGGGHR